MVFGYEWVSGKYHPPLLQIFFILMLTQIFVKKIENFYFKIEKISLGNQEAGYYILLLSFKQISW